MRDVKYDADSCRLAALSTEGCIKLLDPARNLRTVRTVGGRPLPTHLRISAIAPCLG